MADEPRYVCLECGEDCGRDRVALERHWRTFGHGPKQVQLDAIDRARWSIAGDGASPPEVADGD